MSQNKNSSITRNGKISNYDDWAFFCACVLEKLTYTLWQKSQGMGYAIKCVIEIECFILIKKFPLIITHPTVIPPSLYIHL